MGFIIKNLSEIFCEDGKKWGMKAFRLSVALNGGIPVLPGYVIWFQDEKEPICLEEFSVLKKELKKIYEQFGEDKKLIVRSSADIEDSEDYNCPGIFKSFPNINTFEKLCEAVMQCLYFKDSEKILQFKGLQNIKDNIENFCVLIQEQLEPEYSGVAFTKIPIPGMLEVKGIMVESVKGHNWELLEGEKQGNTYFVYEKNTSVEVIDINGNNVPAKMNSDHILTELYRSVENIKKFFGEELDIEWGYKDQIYIFQIRNINIGKKYTKLRYPLKVYSDEQKYQLGLKAEAMMFLKHINLFPEELLVFDKDTHIFEIERKIMGMSSLNERLTIRFSFHQELGLPRHFAKTKLETVQYIKENRKAMWTTIVHNSINVNRSYEVYMDKEKIIIEHVPGMWESDSKLRADFIVIKDNNMFIERVVGERKAKFENCFGVSIENSKPFKKDELREKVRLIYKDLMIVKKKWREKYPINLHLVEDEKERFCFLNIRPASDIEFFLRPAKQLFEIKDRNDLDKWNQEDDLVLRLDIGRGEENRLFQIIPRLKNIKRPVYVEFGILSHPAILLRENGICVLPLFKGYEKDTAKI